MEPRTITRYLAFAMAAGITCSAASAAAQEPPAASPTVPPPAAPDPTSLSELSRRIAALEAQQHALELRLAAERKAASEEKARVAKGKGVEVSAAAGKGLTVKTAG